MRVAGRRHQQRDGAGAASTTGTVASEATAANVARVGFLTNYARLQAMPGGGGMLCWRDSGVNWRQYDKVMFERIQVFIKPGSQNAVDPTDLKMLIDYFHADLVKAVQGNVQVVTAPGPGVRACASRSPISCPPTPSRALPARPRRTASSRDRFGCCDRPARRLDALSRPDRHGSPVPRRRDRQPVAECADTEIGLKYAADVNAGAAGAAEAWVSGYMDSFSQWTYAKNAFDKWSADFARRFAALRNG